MAIPFFKANSDAFIVPSAMMPNANELPEPAFHSFYHRRIKDADDSVPKYSGFVVSQLMFMVKLLGVKLKS